MRRSLGGRGPFEEACWFGNRSLLCCAVRPRSWALGLDGRGRRREPSESTCLRSGRSRFYRGSDTTFSMGAACASRRIRSDCDHPARRIWNPFTAGDYMAGGREPPTVSRTLVWLVPLEVGLLAMAFVVDPSNEKRPS